MRPCPSSSSMMRLPGCSSRLATQVRFSIRTESEASLSKDYASGYLLLWNSYHMAGRLSDEQQHTGPACIIREGCLRRPGGCSTKFFLSCSLKLAWEGAGLTFTEWPRSKICKVTFPVASKTTMPSPVDGEVANSKKRSTSPSLHGAHAFNKLAVAFDSRCLEPCM